MPRQRKTFYLVNWQGQRSSDISKIAEIIKEEFDIRLVGTRHLNFPLAIDTIVEPEAMIHLDEGVRLFRKMNRKVLQGI